MNINMEMITQIALLLLTITFGAVSAYLSENQKLRNGAVKYIAQAEELYCDTTKAGEIKFAWVVDNLYRIIPAPLKMVISKSLVEKIVQNTFDGINKYNKVQLEKFIQQYTENTEMEDKASESND